jgi:simple sugar transport system permease protein
MSGLINFLKKKYVIIAPLLIIIFIAQNEQYSQLTSSGTFGSALRLSIPILLAGLGGLFSERTGVVNIGLEGMMIMGTWFGAWGGYMYGPWGGVLFGLIGGGLFGLIHAIATVSFQVDHIVSGVAINILAVGAARFFNILAFDGIAFASSTASPRIEREVGKFNLPFLTGGSLNGNETSNILGDLENANIFLISDISGLLVGLTSNISYFTIIALLIVPLSVYVLWRTPIGLQMRSVGEYPSGSESLGVNVYLMKYIGVIISGCLAGLAGAYLVLEGPNVYLQGQTGGRGFIGLASLLFGNYRPFGVLMGAGLFGFADALQLRSEEAIHGLLFAVALFLFVLTINNLSKRNFRGTIGSFITGLFFLIWYLNSTSVPIQFIYFTPHLTTLVVLSFSKQKFRMPKKVGVAYKKGELN